MQTSVFKHLTMVEFGVGAVEKIGDKVKELLGTKALIVTDNTFFCVVEVSLTDFTDSHF